MHPPGAFWRRPDQGLTGRLQRACRSFAAFASVSSPLGPCPTDDNDYHRKRLPGRHLRLGGGIAAPQMRADRGKRTGHVSPDLSRAERRPALSRRRRRTGRKLLRTRECCRIARGLRVRSRLSGRLARLLRLMGATMTKWSPNSWRGMPIEQVPDLSGPGSAGRDRGAARHLSAAGFCRRGAQAQEAACGRGSRRRLPAARAETVPRASPSTAPTTSATSSASSCRCRWC